MADIDSLSCTPYRVAWVRAMDVCAGHMRDDERDNSYLKQNTHFRSNHFLLSKFAPTVLF